MCHPAATAARIASVISLVVRVFLGVLFWVALLVYAASMLYVVTWQALASLEGIVVVLALSVERVRQLGDVWGGTALLV